MTSLTLTIPWSMLVPDNAKYGVVSQRGKARLILTSKYRHAKQSIYELAMMARRGRDPFQCPVTLTAVVYEPNRSRTRDVTNFCKLVHDALNGEFYDDDSLIDDAHWIRGGIDKANPRLELTITPISPISEEGSNNDID